MYDGWPMREVAQVQYVYHGVGNRVAAVVVCLISANDRDGMLTAFDKFKDSVKLIDLETDSDRPPPYYTSYRLIYRLWGKKTFDPQDDVPAALGGLVRCGLYIAKLDPAEVPPTIESLHRLIIDYKRDNPNQAVPLMWLFYQWDQITGMGVHLAAIEDDQLVSSARHYFSTLKSVSPKKYPACLR